VKRHSQRFNLSLLLRFLRLRLPLVHRYGRAVAKTNTPNIGRVERHGGRLRALFLLRLSLRLLCVLTLVHRHSCSVTAANAPDVRRVEWHGGGGRLGSRWLSSLLVRCDSRSVTQPNAANRRGVKRNGCWLLSRLVLLRTLLLLLCFALVHSDCGAVTQSEACAAACKADAEAGQAARAAKTSSDWGSRSDVLCFDTAIGRRALSGRGSGGSGDGGGSLLGLSRLLRLPLCLPLPLLVALVHGNRGAVATAEARAAACKADAEPRDPAHAKTLEEGRVERVVLGLSIVTAVSGSSSAEDRGQLVLAARVAEDQRARVHARSSD
jgi:hypothetical protein